MQRVVPAFRITDYLKSKEFYVSGLGFQVDWEHQFEPDFPYFVQISRDDMEIYLTEHTGDCQVGGLIHFFVADVDSLYAELVGKCSILGRIKPPQPLEELRIMTVTDPDGNQLRFCMER
ncbi:glyoxalase superfamily protein [Paenibacillus sp. GCM10027627]|uniref:glyoxalase superfamily protein n=1 Tax=unclassified Paenibacillus TaxID=185978 RepID=UPI003638EF3B